MQTKIILIQEPYVLNGKIRGLESDGNMYYWGETPRAAVLMSKEISGWQLSQFCDRDCTAVETNWAIGKVVFASVYMPSDCEEVPNRKLIELQSFCESSNIPLIVGTDCHAHSQLWGSFDTNERGEKLMNFIMSPLHQNVETKNAEMKNVDKNMVESKNVEKRQILHRYLKTIKNLERILQSLIQTDSVKRIVGGR